MKQQVHEAPSSLIPDMIFSTEHGTWIMDAKYYLPLPGRAGNLPLGLPGTSDITKQFLYQQALQRPEAHHNSGRIIRQPVHNAFLMPSPLSAPADPIRHWKIAECSESTGSILALCFAARLITSSPAATRVSLFARAIVFPAFTAEIVDSSPLNPTIDVSTMSMLSPETRSHTDFIPAKTFI